MKKKITESQLRNIITESIKNALKEDIGKNNNYILYAVSRTPMREEDLLRLPLSDKYLFPKFRGNGVFLARKSEAIALARRSAYGKIVNIISAPMDLGYREERIKGEGMCILVPYSELDKLQVVNHIDVNHQENESKKTVTESQLKNIIAESVKKVLKEAYDEDGQYYTEMISMNKLKNKLEIRFNGVNELLENAFQCLVRKDLNGVRKYMSQASCQAEGGLDDIKTWWIEDAEEDEI